MSDKDRRNLKSAARVALAATVLLGGLMLLPRGASQIVVPDANAQIPTPTLPPILPGKPDPTPTVTPTPKPTKSPPKKKEEKDPDGGGGGSNNTGGSNNERNTGPNTGKNKKNQAGQTGKNKKKNKKNKLPKPPAGVVRISGSYTTDKLVAVAARLRSLGRPADEVVSQVFAPFIIGGEAAWIDTWGAPRYGPGPIVRTHEGQDVFCNYGSPVLATEAGTVEFDEGGLGGKIARLYRRDGSYWYYAHLSAFNTKDFQNGDAVQVGDIIGYCGNTGNALTTPPHVHFGWYQPNGEAKNPMLALIRWLRKAEGKAGVELTKRTNERVENIEPLTLAHRFGDAFTPDVSTIGIAGESLFAYGSTPSAGSLSVVQSALQAALSGDSDALPAVQDAGNLAGPTQVELDPDSELAKLIFGETATHESAD